MSEMVYTHLAVPHALWNQFLEQSQLQGTTVEDQLREALEYYLTYVKTNENRIIHPLLALANLGECAEDDISERTEEILAAEINSVTGWEAVDANSG